MRCRRIALLTGTESAKTVTATIQRLAPAVVHLSLRDGKSGQSETLTCTPEHPLFVSGRGWVAAGSLGIGTSIVSRAGPLLSVSGLTWEREAAGSADGGGTEDSKPYTVYNLTVEDDHTYFVGSLGGGTWVHNACNLTSRIGESPYATRLANRLENTPAQADVDNLTARLSEGNRNPGIGTRSLGEGFYELRGANQGRVIVKQTGEDAYDIVGKFIGHARGDAANSTTIQNLVGGYVP